MLHHMAGIVQSAPPTVLFQATVGADTTFDPSIVGFTPTGVNWDFGGGAANVDGGAGAQSVAITGAPVNISASTTETIGAWTLTSPSDQLTSLSNINDQVTQIRAQANLLTDPSFITSLSNLTFLNVASNSLAGNVNFGTNTSYTNIQLFSNPGLNGTLAVAGMAGLQQIRVAGCAFTSIPYQNLTNLTVLDIGGNSIPDTEVDARLLTSLQALRGGGLPLVTNVRMPAGLLEVNFPSCSINQFQDGFPASLVTVALNDNNIGDGLLPFATLTNLTSFSVSLNDLSATEIDTMLTTFDGFGAAFAAGLTLNYTGQTGNTHLDTARSAAALTAKNNMIANGVTLIGSY